MMKKTMTMLLILGFTLSTLLFAASCAKKQIKGEGEVTPTVKPAPKMMPEEEMKKEEKAPMMGETEAERMQREARAAKLKIEMTADAVAFNGTPCSFDALDGRLAHFGDKTLPVVLYIDEEVSYRRVMTLLDLLQKHRLLNVALISERPKNL